VVGQFGFASAVPLLNQVNNLLLARPAMSRGGLPVDPRPATVSRGTICWPGGQDLPAGDSNCRRRLASWLLDDSQPPTLLLPGRRGAGSASRCGVMNTANGWRRIVPARAKGGRCLAAAAGTLAAAGERRARVWPASRACPPLQTQDAAPLVLSGVREGR
jgi:penicillin-binding protein 1C